MPATCQLIDIVCDLTRRTADLELELLARRIEEEVRGCRVMTSASQFRLQPSLVKGSAMSDTPHDEPQDPSERAKGNGKEQSNAAPEDVFSRAARARRNPDEGLVRVSVRKPSLITVRTPASTWYVRASRDPDMAHVHDLLHTKELDDNHYFVEDEDLIEDIREINPRVIKPLLLHLAVTKQGSAFLWKCGLPDEQGALNLLARVRTRDDRAGEGSVDHHHAQQAVSADMTYRPADREQGEPIWPKLHGRNLCG